ncbi:MAG: FtsX-like permease family protein [Pseudomonas sp.]|uniref:ABC transporter permease n=1 Tax=Pseudomonas sp. TaxID=306 RepID=UPI0030F21641
MRIGLLLSLAWADYRTEARLSICAVLALTAVITPLLVLFGLKFGLVSTLTERLENDPAVREVITLGGGRFSAKEIAQLALRDDVAFALPRTRQIAATADLSTAASGQALTVEMIPTASGDPLLASAPLPAGDEQILLTQSAAEKLGVKAGDRLGARFGRRQDGQAESRQLSVTVLAVLPLATFNRDALFAPLSLLEAAEDYRDGRAVPRLDWPGREPAEPGSRVYPGLRLYAANLDGVESLRQHFNASGQEVSTQAQTIAQVRSLSHNLNLVFWIISGLAVAGAFAAIVASTLAAVERKRRALAVLRLLGFPTAALVAFLVLLALYSGVFSLGLAWLLYGLAQVGLNALFESAAGEFVCRLLPVHYLIALLATLACSILAAALGGWRAAQIEASEGLRDV